MTKEKVDETLTGDALIEAEFGNGQMDAPKPKTAIVSAPKGAVAVGYAEAVAYWASGRAAGEAAEMMAEYTVTDGSGKRTYYVPAPVVVPTNPLPPVVME